MFNRVKHVLKNISAVIDTFPTYIMVLIPCFGITAEGIIILTSNPGSLWNLAFGIFLVAGSLYLNWYMYRVGLDFVEHYNQIGQ